jgi:hypothetical protein
MIETGIGKDRPAKSGNSLGKIRHERMSADKHALSEAKRAGEVPSAGFVGAQSSWCGVNLGVRPIFTPRDGVGPGIAE